MLILKHFDNKRKFGSGLPERKWRPILLKMEFLEHKKKNAKGKNGRIEKEKKYWKNLKIGKLIKKTRKKLIWKPRV